MTSDETLRQMQAAGTIGPAPTVNAPPDPAPPPDPATAKLAAAAGAPSDADAGDVLRHAADKLDSLNADLAKSNARYAEVSHELEAAKAELQQAHDDLAAANQMVSEGGASAAHQEAMHADAIKAAEKRVELAELHADEVEGRFGELLDEIAVQVDGKNPTMMFRPNLGKIEAYTVTIPAVLLARMMKFRPKRPVAGDIKADEIATR